MPPFNRVRRFLHRERGLSWVSAVLLIALAGGSYVVYVWAPIYFDNYTVKQVVQDYMNRARKEPSNEHLKDEMMNKLRNVASLDFQAADGTAQRTPALDIKSEQVLWEHNPETKKLHVAFEYTRQIYYPLLNRWTERTYSIDRTEDLTAVRW